MESEDKKEGLTEAEIKETVDSVEQINEEGNTTSENKISETNEEVKLTEEKIEEPTTLENEKIENNVVEPEKPNKKNQSKKKLLIIIGIISLILVAVLSLFIIFYNEDVKESDDDTHYSKGDIGNQLNNSEYLSVMREYGNKLALYLTDYLKNGHDIDDIKVQALENFLEGYTVKCETFNIGKEGDMYLDKCSINGSDAVYNYATIIEINNDSDEEDECDIDDDCEDDDDEDYVYKSEDGQLIFYSDGTEISGGKEKNYKKYIIACEEDECFLEDFFEYYAIVRESSGKKNVYKYDTGEKIYSTQSGGQVKLLVKSGEKDKAIALLLRKSNKQEALYSIEQKKMIFDFGVYTYEWDDDFYHYDSNYPNISKTIQFYKNKKAGLIYVEDYSIIIEPKEYDYFHEGGNYIFTTKEKYEGLLYYDYEARKLTKIFDADTYDKIVFGTDDYIYVVKDNKVGIYDEDSKSFLLNGKLYNAVVLIDYDDSGAFVLDNKTFKIVDKEGNLIKTVGTVKKTLKLFYHTFFDSYMFGYYYDEEEKETVAWFQFANPNYDETANEEYYDCTDICEELEDDDEYNDCYDSCDLLYDDDANFDCIEYYYTFETDKLKKENVECINYAKPVLYLYPTLPTLITVTFDNPENLTTTYPKYESSWKVLANKNGDLYDLNDKYYYALYWEEKGNHKVDFSEGFYVTKNNAIEFLEEKLTKIGLNDRERNEFIMYWLPILEENGKSLVYFELTEERDSYSKINIQPQPDSLLRVAIHVKKVDSYTKIKEQKLPIFKRSGFTAVEWGGVLY